MDECPTMEIDAVLWECFRHFAHMDEANAAMHTAPVRYSPITFRVAEHLYDLLGTDRLDRSNEALLAQVKIHAGKYPEDTGR